MASTALDIGWKANFYDLGGLVLNSNDETYFGNTHVKFALSATINFEVINFYIRIHPFSTLKAIVCTLQYSSSSIRFSTFQEKPVLINGTKILFASLLCMKTNVDYVVVRSASIGLKITYLDEKVSSFSHTWNSSDILNTVNQTWILCRQLTNLKLNSTLADVTIEADGKEFKVHSAVLAMRSSVFAAMFSDKKHFKESNEKKVKIEDISDQVMEAFLAFLYGQGNIEWKSIAADLAKVADKYDVKPLLTVCVRSLSADITVETAAKNFHCAHQLGMTESLRKIGQFICLNKTAVKATDGWTEYFQSNSELFEALFEATTI